jgi:cytochrome c-type biogenesis protein CcmH/NrfG
VLARHNLEVVYRRSGHYQDEIARAEAQVRATPDAQSFFRLAEALRNTGQYESAAKAYRRVLKLKPADLLAPSPWA